MEGYHDYIYCLKIKAIEFIAQKFSGEAVLYFDNDTFCYHPLDASKTHLEKDGFLMHKPEKPLSQMKTKLLKRMWWQVKDKQYAGYKVSDKDFMWNAGVFGIPGKGAIATCENVLAVCDAMLDDRVDPKFVEQFAFSLVLNQTGILKKTEEAIAHYWSNKYRWNLFIQQLFEECWLSARSVPEQLEMIRELDLTAIPIYAKTPNTKLRLMKLLDKWFPDKISEYLK